MTSAVAKQKFFSQTIFMGFVYVYIIELARSRPAEIGEEP